MSLDPRPAAAPVLPLPHSKGTTFPLPAALNFRSSTKSSPKASPCKCMQIYANERHLIELTGLCLPNVCAVRLYPGGVWGQGKGGVGTWASGSARLLAERPRGALPCRMPSMTSWTPSTTRTSPPAPPPPSAPPPSGGSHRHPAPALPLAAIPCLSFPTPNRKRAALMAEKPPRTSPAFAAIWELINLGFF